MKRILILLIIPLILSGCYDYNELNDLAIISGVGIDYEDDNFILTFEILSTKKEGEKSGSSGTYNITTKGKTIAEAFSNSGNNLDKVPYFEHIDIIVISEDIAYNHLDEVSEYLIRSTEVRNEFYMAIGKNYTSKEIISKTSKEKPSSAQVIVGLLENSKDTSSAGYYDLFTRSVSKMITDGKDAILPIVTLNEEDIELNGMGVFKDFKLVHTFNTKDASIMNLLNNFDYNSIVLKHKCDKGSTVVSLYEGKIGIDPSDDKVLVEAKISAKVNEDTCGFDFRDEKTYIELEKEFTKVLEKELDSVINELKKAKSNALSIGKTYYDKTRNKAYFKWTTENFEYKINLKVNRKGLTFEVN
ncbi:MAG: Ger(x)C family spore germination protein [Ruminococcus sp.]|nr:Ger(x)C family spore germination protein [Ruminococcus sp.]